MSNLLLATLDLPRADHVMACVQAFMLRSALQAATPEECQASLRSCGIARLSPERALVVLGQRIDMAQA